ncbi:hypothetical protein BDZ91DRAFT_720308 [Kalaharituber pfeilii]|nr:hypothetical protein BDZ91DRAFT_720308 [Kalaharituber pfeilii]
MHPNHPLLLLLPQYLSKCSSVFKSPLLVITTVVPSSLSFAIWEAHAPEDLSHFPSLLWPLYFRLLRSIAGRLVLWGERSRGMVQPCGLGSSISGHCQFLDHGTLH